MKKILKKLIVVSLLIASCENQYDVNNHGIGNNDDIVINSNSEISIPEFNESSNTINNSNNDDFHKTSNEISKENIYVPYENFDDVLNSYSYLYKSAINEKDSEIRTIMLAKAEEYLLDSCVAFPYMDNCLNYGITRVVPNSYLHYNSYPYSMDNLIVTNEILDKETINEINNVDNIKQFLIDKGYSFKNKVSFFCFEEINSLNLFNKLNFDNRLILSQCQSSLFKVDNKGNLINDLCESYSVSEDGYTFTFILKDDIYWYNYNSEIVDEIKASDFITGLKYYISNMAGNSKIAGVEEYLNNLYTFDEVKIKAISDKELSISLVEPNVNFFYEIISYLFPLHKDNLALFSSNEKEFTYKDLYYSGSYVIKEIDNNKILLNKNKKYHNADNVNMDEISFYYELIPSNSIIDKIISGEYDHLSCSYNDKMYKLLTKNALTKDIYCPFKSKHIINYGYFNLDKEHMNDINIRKGLVFSFNKEKFISLDCDTNYVSQLITNSFTPSNISNLSNNSILANMNYGEIIKYFASKREIKVDYTNTYNEQLAKYYFEKYFNEKFDGNSIVLSIVTTKNDESKVNGYLDDVKRISNNKIDFNIIVVNNQYDYYVMTNKKEYDIILFNYWTPDYYDASAFISPFINIGE